MHSLRSALRVMTDMILPPTCLRCGAEVGEPGALCVVCWQRLQFFAPPWCACCGRPFDVWMGDDALCGACVQSRPVWDWARSAFCYDDASRPLVLALKHADRQDGVPSFARWMAQAGASRIEPKSLFVPVPLHRWRLLRRRYNQSALLAQDLARLCGGTYCPDSLRRVRRTTSQGHLTRTQRQDNVRGAFGISDAQSHVFTDAHVVLVDDVMTTGATMEECCRMLRKAKVATIGVLTLARAML